MPKGKLRDELKSLTSGVAATGLEYVKHRKKKKQLRGGIVPLIVMGLQAGIMELASWALEQDAKKEREEAERIERHNQMVWEREAEREQHQANAAAARDFAEEQGNIQRQYANQYKDQLRAQLEREKREEEEYLNQQDLIRRAEEADKAERDKAVFLGDIQRQTYAARQRQLEREQLDAQAQRDADFERIRLSQANIDALQQASQQRFDLELRQRLRSVQARQQTQMLPQRQAVRIAPKSTQVKMGKRPTAPAKTLPAAQPPAQARAQRQQRQRTF